MGSLFLYQGVEYVAVGEFSVGEAYYVYLCLYGQFHVGGPVDVLVEDVSDAFVGYGCLHEEFVHSLKGCLEPHGDGCYDGVDAFPVHLGETESAGPEKLVAGVLEVVLVVGVVDYSLYVALVVADFHPCFVYVLHFLVFLWGVYCAPNSFTACKVTKKVKRAVRFSCIIARL